MQDEEKTDQLAGTSDDNSSLNHGQDTSLTSMDSPEIVALWTERA